MTWLKKHLKKPLVILFLLGFLIYLPSLGNKLVWDDEQFIYKNVFVQNFDLKKIWTTNTIAGAGQISNYYRPLTTTSFALDYQFWGLNPIGFHLTNTLLHTGAGLLLFLLLKKLGIKKTWALSIAIIFLVHPLQTEAVVYANSRGDSFYVFWLLLGLLSFVLSWQKTALKWQIYDKIFTFHRPILLAITLTSYLLAILAKEIGLAGLGLFGLIWMLKVISYKKAKTKLFKLFTPQFLTLAGLVIIAISYLGLRATTLNFNNSFNFHGELQDTYTQNLATRLLTFSKILWIYWRLLFIPYPLHMERTTSYVTSWLSPWPWLTLIILTIITWLGWQEKKQFKSLWIWFGISWFLIMLIPSSGIIPINGLLYEHWLYLPMVGFWLTLLGIGKLILTWLKITLTNSKIWIYLFVGLVSIWILLTLRQNYIWGNPVRFYTYTLQFNQSTRLHNNLGMILADKKQFQKAIEQYRLALNLQKNSATYHNLGNSYLALNQLESAKKSYEQAIKLDKEFHYSYLNLIKINLELDLPVEAEQIGEQLIELYSDDPQVKALIQQLKK